MPLSDKPNGGKCANAENTESHPPTVSRGCRVLYLVIGKLSSYPYRHRTVASVRCIYTTAPDEQLASCGYPAVPIYEIHARRLSACLARTAAMQYFLDDHLVGSI